MNVKEIMDQYKLPELENCMSKSGFQVSYTSETATTMNLAQAYIEIGRALPAVFLTDHQTNGKGREGRFWLDRRGASILVSTALMIKDDTIPVFSDMTALHICRVLKAETGIDGCMVKYPNDFVLEGRKLGGMLTLNHYDGEKSYLGTTLGVGINVHYSQEEMERYPSDYGTTALDLHTQKPNSRQTILLAVLNGLKGLAMDAEIFQTNLQFQQDQNNLWKTHSYVYGRQVWIEAGDVAIIKGRVVDTAIGKGILLDSSKRWFNQFGTRMKVRVLD